MQTRTSVGRDFQDAMLGRLAEHRLITTIYLRNRMSLRGRIVEFDPYVLLLEPLDGSPPQMVYKSSVVSISGPPRRGGPGGGPPRRPGFRPGGPDSRPYEGRPRYDGPPRNDGRPPYHGPQPDSRGHRDDAPPPRQPESE